MARDVVKAEDVVDFTEKQSISERFARRFGASMGSALAGGFAEGVLRDLHLR